MITGTVPGAAGLYRDSAEMRGFVRFWVRRKRCPLPLVDFLTEHGLERPAECARWCATEPDRPGWDYWARKEPGRLTMRGPYPQLRFTGDWAWCVRVSGDPQEYFDDVPAHCAALKSVGHAGPAAAILALLDAWKDGGP